MGWYAIVASGEIKRINHPYALPIFGINLVIWRNEQRLVRVMVDKCPHQVYFGNEASYLKLSQINDLTRLLGRTFSEIKKTWQANITRYIENQLNYAHLPMVHKSTIGRKSISLQIHGFCTLVLR